MWTSAVCSILLLFTEHCLLLTHGFLSAIFDSDDQSDFSWVDV